MIHKLNNNTELKYIGIIVVLATLIQLVTTEQGWRDILFVIQFIFVELFLLLSFQDLSQNLNSRVLELKRLCNLTQATNTRLIKDVVALKGLMRKSQGPHKETVYENTSRVVMGALKSNAPAKRGRKLVSQHNKKNRMKPYVVKNVHNIPKPVEVKEQEPSYVKMEASAANQHRQDAPILRQRSPMRRARPSKMIQEKDELVIKAEDTKQMVNDEHNQAFENCVREQQYFCTRKNLNGRNVYERLCLNCAAVMKQVGHPIYSSICQTCKPIQGQNLTHYKRLSKFKDLIEFYCACEMCFTSKEPPCLREYCKLCTIPRLTRKLDKERTPLVDYEEWNGID